MYATWRTCMYSAQCTPHHTQTHPHPGMHAQTHSPAPHHPPTHPPTHTHTHTHTHTQKRRDGERDRGLLSAGSGPEQKSRDVYPLRQIYANWHTYMHSSQRTPHNTQTHPHPCMQAQTHNSHPHMHTHKSGGMERERGEEGK